MKITCNSSTNMVNEDKFDAIPGCVLALRKFNKLRNRYKAAYLKWRDNRWMNIAGIEPMIESLEETRNNCNIASLSGGCAGLVGGILTGAGLITIPFTVGATAPLIIAGASLAVSGGATGFGAGIADLKISNNKCKEAQVLIDRDVELTMDLLLLEKEFAQCLTVIETTLLELRTKQPADYDRLSQCFSTSVSAVGASRIGANLALVAMVARSICIARLGGSLSLSTAQVVNNVNPLSLLGAARVADSVDDVVEAGSQVGVAAVRGAKAGIAAAAILCVVGLALDITSIVYTSRQIHVYRKKKQGTLSSTSDEKSSLTGSTTSLHSNENLHNNNKIYLKSIDKELTSGYDMCSLPTTPSGGISPHKTPSGGELWADVVSSGGSFWKDECVEGMEAIGSKVETSSSRRSSDSWEKVDYTPDMLIEVDEECLFQNKQFSLQFDSDILEGTSVSSTTTNETQKLIAQDAVGNESGSFPEKIVRKIKHSFTKEYISDRAEKLRKYIERLLREAVAMERNPTISDLLNDCRCQQCAAVGGASSVYCCQEKRFHWNCVYDVHQSQTEAQTPTTHNTPSLCVTQHPKFKQLYLTESGLKEELEREFGTEVCTLPKHRLLRYCAYRLIVRSCWGNNDITVKIPDCIRRVVTNTFQPEIIDVWNNKDGLQIKDIWEIKDSVTCSIM